eukprot:8414801-Pyramimonas_sp.AAC.1
MVQNPKVTWFRPQNQLVSSGCQERVPKLALSLPETPERPSSLSQLPPLPYRTVTVRLLALGVLKQPPKFFTPQ